MSRIVDFLKLHKGEEGYTFLGLRKIKIGYDPNYPSLRIFNYCQGADFTNPIVQEARGIIIDVEKMEVVCWPFRKFCNYGEVGADKIDWSTARVQEKVDGSIVKLWYYEGKWHWSTNGVIDAYKATVERYNMSFGEIIERADWVETNDLNKNHTYIFELVSPYNRVVIDYHKTALYQIGERDNITGIEYEPSLNMRRPAMYNLGSVEECIKAAAALNPKGRKEVLNEGFVVVDANWNRVKIKTPEYLYTHHLIPNGEISDRKLLRLFIDGEIEEVLAYVPSLESRVRCLEADFNKFKYQYGAIVEYYDAEFKELGRRDFGIKYHNEFWFSTYLHYAARNKEPDDLYFYNLYKKARGWN